MSNTSPEAAIRKLLESAGDVTALRASRMYPGIAPNNTAHPFQVYSRVTREHYHHMTGHSGFAQARVQVDSYSDNKIEVDDLAEKTRVYLEPLSGSTTIGSNSITINRIRMEEDDATSEPSGDGSDLTLHRIRQEYIVEHAVSIP